jgi:hypothetical protein
VARQRLLSITWLPCDVGAHGADATWLARVHLPVTLGSPLDPFVVRVA